MSVARLCETRCLKMEARGLRTVVAATTSVKMCVTSSSSRAERGTSHVIEDLRDPSLSLRMTINEL